MLDEGHVSLVPANKRDHGWESQLGTRGRTNPNLSHTHVGLVIGFFGVGGKRTVEARTWTDTLFVQPYGEMYAHYSDVNHIFAI